MTKKNDEVKEEVKEPEVKEEVKAKAPEFYVMPGKCLTSPRGLIATEANAEIKDYAEIKVEDLAGGKDALRYFIESGHIGKG